LAATNTKHHRISESWATATSNAIARGVHIAKFTPVGYDRRPDKRLVPDAHAPAIREAFQMRIAHKTRTEIARRLDQTAPRPHEGRWTPAKVDRVIKNRVYTGEAYRGDAVNPNAHEAIVSAAEWQLANHVPTRASPRSKKVNLLGGIVRCASCRYVLAPQIYGSGRPKPTLVYRCRGLHGAGACPAPASILRPAVERYVEAAWRTQMASQALTVKRDSQALEDATTAFRRAEEELAAFAADITARRLLGGGYHAALEVRTNAVHQAQIVLAQATALTPSAEVIEGYDQLPVAERKRILSSSIDAVVVRPGHTREPVAERITILWRGEGPEDLPRPGRENGPVRPYLP
jgi:hypothetical protein